MNQPAAEMQLPGKWREGYAVPDGDHRGWPTLESSGVPARRCTLKSFRSRMKIPGARLPVYSSPQSSWSMQEIQREHFVTGDATFEAGIQGAALQIKSELCAVI